MSGVVEHILRLRDQVSRNADQADRSVLRLTRTTERAEQAVEDLDLAERGLADQLDRTTRATERQGRTAGQTASALRRMGRSARSSGRLFKGLAGTLSTTASSAGQLSGVVGALVPGMGGLATTIGDVAGAAELFAGAGGAVLRVLGPVAIAVSAAAAAYTILNNRLKEANERAREAAKIASLAQVGKESRLGFEERTQQMEDIAAGRRGRREELIDEVTGLFADQLNPLRGKQGTILDSGMMERNDAEAVQAQKEFAELKQREGAMQAKILELVENRLKAEQALAEMERAKTDRSQRDRTSQEDAGPQSLSNLMGRRISAGMDGVAAGDFSTRYAAQQAQIQAETEGIRQAQREQQLRGVAGALNAASSGARGLTNLIGQTGPAGAIAAGAMNFAGTLGEQGGQETAEQLVEEVSNIGRGIGELPEFLTRLIAGLLTDLPMAIVEGLANALMDIFAGLEAAIRWLSDREYRQQQRNRNRNNGTRNRRLLQIAGAFSTDDFGLLDSLARFDSGTSYVARSGAYMLHQGEAVVNTSGTTTGRLQEQMRSVSGGTNLTIQSLWPPSAQQVNDTVREINRHTGGGARGLAFNGNGG
ncbi:MAG: hypothetical protein AAFR76_01475 [Planctomycetota bacterium]